MFTENNINKKVLITGASRGIGAAIATEFARNGYELYITCSKTIGQLNSLANFLTEEYNVKCHPIQTDMSDYSSVEELFNSISDLDVLINNAGISYIGLLNEMSHDDWNQIVNVNLGSVFNTCKFAIPLFLKKHSGTIINISSVWGNVGASMEVAYSATKGGVNTFTKALAKELAPSNISVNAIACGMINTSMNSSFSKEEIEEIKNEIPADRIGEPHEVGKLCMLIAESPSYMTGQIITMDGGWT